MPRDSKGRFVKGHDPDRHVFTEAECKAGHEELVRRMPGESYQLRRSQAHRVVTKADCTRHGEPEPVWPDKVRFGVNDSQRDRAEWLQHGTEG